jgi:molybdate transport system ATP-binding protein
VALARALIRQPKALLLDEPFSALDRPLRLEMRHFLKELMHRFKIPVVLVTHDFEEAAAMADKIIIYENGNISQTGSPEEVQKNQQIQRRMTNDLRH